MKMYPELSDGIKAGVHLKSGEHSHLLHGNPYFTTVLSVMLLNINGYPIILLKILKTGRETISFLDEIITENTFETTLRQ